MKNMLMMVLSAGLLLTGVGCAAQQKGPETAEYGLSRSDADRPESEPAPAGREFWTKMR